MVFLFVSRPLGQYDLERLSRGNEPAITNHITLLSNDSRQASAHTKRVKPPTIARKSRQATFAIKTLFLDVTYIEEDTYSQSRNCYPSLFKVWYPWSHFIRRYFMYSMKSYHPGQKESSDWFTLGTNMCWWLQLKVSKMNLNQWISQDGVAM